MQRLDDGDLDRIEAALATLSEVAPRGWVVADEVTPYIGNVKRDGTVGRGFNVGTFGTSEGLNHKRDMRIAIAAVTVLNDAGRILHELRKARDGG